MDLFKDGKLDEKKAAAYVRALESQLLTRDKEWLAQKFAVEIVNNEIWRQLRESMEEERARLEFDLHRSHQSIIKGALAQLDDRREDWLMGIRHRRVQRARRSDKPAADPYDDGRNERIRAYHARLEAEGELDATAQTAAAFELSDRRIRQIVKK